MSKIVLDTNLPRIVHKIKCPIHYVLKPGGFPFIMERDPRFLSIKEADAKIFGLRLWRKKKDRFGRPMPNWKDFFQPVLPASWFREQVYRADSPECLKCRRCWAK